MLCPHIIVKLTVTSLGVKHFRILHWIVLIGIYMYYVGIVDEVAYIHIIHTHNTHTHIHNDLMLYVCIVVCACVCVYMNIESFSGLQGLNLWSMSSGIRTHCDLNCV